MNVQQVDKSMGFFGIFKEAYKLINRSSLRFFSQIILATILPLTILLMSEYQVSYHIATKTYQTNDGEKSRWILYAVTKFLYFIFTICFYLFSSATISYVVACSYTSKDITFKKAISVFPKVWGRLVVTFLWWFLAAFIYSGVAFLLFFAFWVSQNGAETKIPETRYAIVVSSISIPYFAGILYMVLVLNTATVVSVLEKDYGRKALVKSMKLIWGKTLVSYVVVLVLEIAVAGILSVFIVFVVLGEMKLVDKILLGMFCYDVMIIVVYFSLVIQSVIYFVCKSYHNEDIANVAQHLEGGPYTNIEREKDVQFEPSAMV